MVYTPHPPPPPLPHPLPLLTPPPLLSDGVWEFIDNQAAVDLVGRCASAEAACRALVDAAHQRWLEAEGGVVDDITCVVVLFGRQQPPGQHGGGEAAAERG